MSGTGPGRSVTVAVCQLAPVVADPTGNRSAAEAAIRAAAGRGATLVVLPELVDSGYVFADRAEAAGLAEDAGSSTTLRRWRALAAELGIVIVGGWCERGAGDDLHNSAAIVDATGVRATYRKVHLWDQEKHVFVPGGDPPPVVDTVAGRIATCVCYDLEFAEWGSMAARSGAEILAVPVNWPLAPRPRS
jgi:predicted amidohydrolase